jgi:hypothetical protein
MFVAVPEKIKVATERLSLSLIRAVVLVFFFSFLFFPFFNWSECFLSKAGEPNSDAHGRHGGLWFDLDVVLYTYFDWN